MIDFEWYRSFISIYKHQSVSEAARSRFLTQPAMSQHLAALEAEVGEALFTRTTRKIIPTERGKELYSRLAPLIETLEKTTLEIRHSIETAPVVTIGSPIDYFSIRGLEKLKNVPSKVIHHQGEAPALFDMLEQNRADVIITTQRFSKPGIEYKQIEKEQFYITAPYEHGNIPEAADAEEWLLNQKWISYGMELPIIRRMWREHFKKRPEMEPHYVIPDLRGILSAVEKGIGISLLPHYLIEHSLIQKRVKTILNEFSVANEIYLGYKVKKKSDPFLLDIMEKLLN
ncbi:LysR family transcriptional regulator [Bacillus sp. FJAT-42376]|uniref:LysR family transcriptional regulator n=1 Tax=Bacillus sp. FJAT-42376 TaxID=2014076 RepID=UPI000F4FF6BF|nr:LysR family transcriptional regulator [Bacillus sp. FJAT-42376]AZB44162.1 LysR family transcriptional regulator [Bacillus sp. FJAT-42376]